jgi:hypothetical protein
VKILYDEAAEAGALACPLGVEPGEARSMIAQMEVEHFHEDHHREIFRAFLALVEDNRPPNVVEVVQYLKDQGRLNEAGGLEYVSRLPDRTHSPAHFPSFLETIKDLAVRRQMVDQAEKLKSLAYDVKTPVDGTTAASGRQLPGIEDATDFTAFELEHPPQLIWGVLHRGCKLAIGGGSKTFKTWSLLDLALSISHGEPWLSFKTTRARVCYANLELPPWSL